ncbi:MAG TPA: hypothetical protein VF763_09725 [Candidatus Limnocylindrales bacterium]
MIPLRTDQACLRSFGYGAVMLATGDARRVWVVASDAEMAAGRVIADDRPRFGTLHDAFEVAHREAVRARRSQESLAA